MDIAILTMLLLLLWVLDGWRREWRRLEAKRQVEWEFAVNRLLKRGTYWEPFHIKGNEEP